MSQIYILTLFVKLLEDHKVRTGRGSQVTHIPVINRYKELVYCNLFIRPADTIISRENVQDACGPLGNIEDANAFVPARISELVEKFDQLADKNIRLLPWPMPNMYIAAHRDLFR